MHLKRLRCHQPRVVPGTRAIPERDGTGLMREPVGVVRRAKATHVIGRSHPLTKPSAADSQSFSTNWVQPAAVGCGSDWIDRRVGIHSARRLQRARINFTPSSTRSASDCVPLRCWFSCFLCRAGKTILTTGGAGLLGGGIRGFFSRHCGSGGGARLVCRRRCAVIGRDDLRNQNLWR